MQLLILLPAQYLRSVYNDLCFILSWGLEQRTLETEYVCLRLADLVHKSPVLLRISHPLLP